MDHSRSWDPRNPPPSTTFWLVSVAGERLWGEEPQARSQPGPRSQVPDDLSLRASSGGFGAQPVTALVRAPPAGWI